MDAVKEVLTFIGIMIAVISPIIGVIVWTISQAVKRGSFMENINHLLENVNSIVQEVTNIKKLIADIREENRQRHRESERQINDLDVRVSKVEVLVFDTNKNVHNMRS